MLQERIESELRSNILPFWLKYGVDQDFGGFRGQITNDLVIDTHADKGLILNARILWTFSRVYGVYKEPHFLDAARRAYEYICTHFRDSEFDGVYWMVDYQGETADDKKRIYGQAFTVHALAEYFHVTRDPSALQFAIALFNAIERASHDDVHEGYFETHERNWSLAADQRLSEVDMNEKKSMNTHLHLMEAYAALLFEWEDETLRKRLRELINLFRTRIINHASHHLIMFFNEEWQPQSDTISYGHDIEASWLLVESAGILGDQALLGEVKQESVRMAQTVYDQALDTDGGLFYEANPKGIVDSDKHWWPQAEALVGFLSAYQISGKKHFLAAAEKSWDFIDKYIVDHQNGEWFWKVSRGGIVSPDQYKVDNWKCPYHNSRACLEAISRLSNL